MATKKKPAASPPVAPTKAELEDVANCFERWAKIIREANGAAVDLGSVSLTWKRAAPAMVHVQVNGAKRPDGFRGDVRQVLALNDTLERASASSSKA